MVKNNFFQPLIRCSHLWLLPIFLAFSLLSPAAASATVFAAETTTADTSAAKSAGTTESTAVAALEDGAYVKGEVLVTVAAPKRTVLAKKGLVPFDEEMTVEKSWGFGDAVVLSSTKEQAVFLGDKNLYISLISSDKYSTQELMGLLSGQAYVVSVEPNRYRQKMSLTNDTFSGQQWYLDGGGNFTTKSQGIHYTKNTSSSKKPVVAVADTGIDYTHEDLKEHMWKNTYSALEGTYGYDFGDDDNDPMDEEGHGTHCAGIIGAVTDNAAGIAGVGGDVELMALKIFNQKGEAEDAAIIDAFHYIYQAMQLGVNITAVNCSWGGGNSASAMETLINKIGQQGALFLFAAGNDGTNQDTINVSQKECPYDLSSDYVITVGASDTTDKAAYFSDYGQNSVDIFAPGSQMFSTVSEPGFLPDIYTEEERKTKTSIFSSGEEDSVTLHTPASLNLPYSWVTYGAFTHSSEDFYGNKESGSFYIAFRSASWRREVTFSAYLDVSEFSLNPLNSYFVSCNYSTDERGVSAREWAHFSRRVSTSDFVTVDGKQYLRLFSIIGDLFTTTGFYIDQIAVSSANPSEDSLVKYDYMDGTSMAAPVVSGAVAALSALFPQDSAYQRRARLMSCVRTVPDLTYKCKTGGIVDMSLFATSATVDNPATPSVSDPEDNTGNKGNTTTSKIAVTKVMLNKKSATLRYKKKLKLKASVSPANASNKAVKWSVSKTKYAKVSQKGVVKAKKKGIGHMVKVYAAAKDGSKKRAVCKVKIKR